MTCWVCLVHCRFGNLLFARTAYPKYQNTAADTTSKGGAPTFVSVQYAAGDQGCAGLVKIWPLLHDSRELRIMILNKALPGTDCNVLIYLTEMYGKGTLQRMVNDPSLGIPTDLRAQVMIFTLSAHH
jgi:hypothetical protein